MTNDESGSDSPNGRPQIDVLGMKLPMIAKLGDGWFLCAHPNGAAIANKDSLSVLSTRSSETKLPPDDAYPAVEDEDAFIPEAIRAKAVEEYERFAWPHVRELFFP